MPAAAVPPAGLVNHSGYPTGSVPHPDSSRGCRGQALRPEGGDSPCPPQTGQGIARDARSTEPG